MNLIREGRRGPHRLAARFVDGPHVSAPDKAEQRLEGLADRSRARSRRLRSIDLIARFPRAKTILLGIAEASPYLFDLIRADAARADPAARMRSGTPSGAIDREHPPRGVIGRSSEADVMQLLRRMKSEAALLIALCDIGGVWPVMQVTAALTDLAVASVQAALRYLLRQEAARGRLSPPSPDRPRTIAA